MKIAYIFLLNLFFLKYYDSISERNDFTFALVTVINPIVSILFLSRIYKIKKSDIYSLKTCILMLKYYIFYSMLIFCFNRIGDSDYSNEIFTLMFSNIFLTVICLLGYYKKGHGSD